MANISKTFIFTGGEDFVTPPLQIPDGMAKSALNYEQNYSTGYTRINGYRDLVDTATPGEGSILGLVVFNDNIFMFRNHIGGLTAGMWKATPTEYRIGSKQAGDAEALWGTNIVVTPGLWTEELNILNSARASTSLKADGYYEFAIGNFKATARDVGTFVGEWVLNTSYTAYDIIEDTAGSLGVVGAKYITYASHKSGALLIDDANRWQDMTWTTDSTPDDSHNISGDAGRLYGVDGKNPAFEFDGVQLTQINSTYTPDTPMHIETNGNRLALGFRAGELALSALGNPLSFDPVLGAGSFGLSDFITGMTAGPDGVMYIRTKDNTYLLYGMQGPLLESELKKHSKDVGAYPYTQHMLSGHSLSFDTWGLMELEATQRFGDVVTSSLSSKVQTAFTERQPIVSIVLKQKAQYRMYAPSVDGNGSQTDCMIATFIGNEGALGFTHATYPMRMATATSGSIDKVEISLAGDTTGGIYQMDIGNSFAGSTYRSVLDLPFNYLGSPHKVKKIRKAIVNVQINSPVTLQYTAAFNNGEFGNPKEKDTDFLAARGATWGASTWNAFEWGEIGTSGYIQAYVNGHGENIGFSIGANSATEEPHTLKDITFIFEKIRIQH